MRCAGLRNSGALSRRACSASIAGSCSVSTRSRSLQAAAASRTSSSSSSSATHESSTPAPPFRLSPAPSFSASSFSCRPTPDIPDSKWDAVIIGGGHNGLVCAATLAGRGLRVCVLERRHVLGGAAVTEEIFPGYKYSRASYLFSLFRPRIVQELELKKHGLKFHFRDPSSFTPMLDGRYLMMGPSMEMTQREIAKFSAEDAAAYPLYEQHLSKLTAYQHNQASAHACATQFFEPFLDAPPPGSARSLRERLSQLRMLGSAARRAVSLGRGLLDFHEVMTAPAARILSRWFQSEPLRSTLATDAIIGAMTSPQVPGSGYVLFHHVMGEVDGRQGVWAYVEGGMGAVSSAIAKAAQARGAALITNAAVQEILLDGSGRVSGLLLANGQTVAARRVISNVSPTVTYGGLLPARHLPAEFMRDVRSIDTTSPVTKINLSMSRLPAFSCCPPLTDAQPGPQHRGTIHFVESMQQIEAAYHDALAGRPSARPVIEMTIPSALDPTLAPAGHHVASLFTQYTPYSIAGGWTAEAKKAYAARCFSLIDQYAPGFSSSVLHYEVLTPPDLEAELGLSGGNIFHTAMGLDQLFWLRPVKGWSRYRSPVDGLYLCGAGTHPGGGVMGSAGRNCAEIVAADLAN